MKTATIKTLLTGLDPVPIFLATIARILDLLTTRVILKLVPETYEAMPLGNNIILSLGFILIPMITIQLTCQYWKLTDIGKAGSWILVIVSTIPVINNLQILQ